MPAPPHHTTPRYGIAYHYCGHLLVYCLHCADIFPLHTPTRRTTPTPHLHAAPFYAHLHQHGIPHTLFGYLVLVCYHTQYMVCRQNSSEKKEGGGEGGEGGRGGRRGNMYVGNLLISGHVGINVLVNAAS